MLGAGPSAGHQHEEGIGESGIALRMAVASEAVGMCLLSYLIALLLVRLLSKTGLWIWSVEAFPWRADALLIACGGFVLLIGLIAGCWPAWYITSFSPALVLKGNFGLSPKGRSFRNVLVGFQFVASLFGYSGLLSRGRITICFIRRLDSIASGLSP